jgi:drug/metabolite transporter (DMT)-like permease
MSLETGNLELQSPSPLRKSPALGPLLMLASAFLFSVLDVLIKTMGPEFRVWDIAFYRWGGSFAMLAIIVCWLGNPLKCHNLKLMIFRSVSGCIAFFALITSIRLIPISTAMVLFYSFPAFAAFFSFLIFRERITKEEILCIIAALFGVAILIDVKLGGNLFGHAMGLLSGAFAGLTISLIKKLREKNGPVAIYLYFSLFGAAVSFPAFIANPILPESGAEWLMIAGIVGSSTAAQLLMNQGFKYCKSWEGSLFLTSEMIFVAFFGIFFLGEITTWRFWIGGLMILGSVVILNRVKTKATSVSKSHVPEPQATM